MIRSTALAKEIANPQPKRREILRCAQNDGASQQQRKCRSLDCARDDSANRATPNGREILRREERSFARSGWQRKAKSTATENAVPQRSDDSATRESKERRAKARRYDGRRDHEMTSPIREPD
jgi:hypothetical protein